MERRGNGRYEGLIGLMRRVEILVYLLLLIRLSNATLAEIHFVLPRSRNGDILLTSG